MGEIKSKLENVEKERIEELKKNSLKILKPQLNSNTKLIMQIFRTRTIPMTKKFNILGKNFNMVNTNTNLKSIPEKFSNFNSNNGKKTEFYKRNDSNYKVVFVYEYYFCIEYFFIKFSFFLINIIKCKKFSFMTK